MFIKPIICIKYKRYFIFYWHESYFFSSYFATYLIQVLLGIILLTSMMNFAGKGEKRNTITLQGKFDGGASHKNCKEVPFSQDAELASYDLNFINLDYRLSS